jgi:hypothetical protein
MKMEFISGSGPFRCPEAERGDRRIKIDSSVCIIYGM